VRSCLGREPGFLSRQAALVLPLNIFSGSVPPETRFPQKIVLDLNLKKCILVGFCGRIFFCFIENPEFRYYVKRSFAVMYSPDT
jgi:hypothetical protein